MNQSNSEKKRGRLNKSDTAPSAIGIDPRFPPLNKLVSRLLALSKGFLVFGSSVLVDWHLYYNNTNKFTMDTISLINCFDTTKRRKT
jgi:hypothetical protein